MDIRRTGVVEAFEAESPGSKGERALPGGSSLFWKSEPKSTRGVAPGPRSTSLKGTPRKLQVCYRSYLLQLLNGRIGETLVGAGGLMETADCRYRRESLKDQQY